MCWLCRFSILFRLNIEIVDKIMQKYLKEQYPCLDHQIKSWSESQPLKGLRIIDATPVFNNTLIKHEALVAAGAELVIGLSDSIPCDSKVVEGVVRSGGSVIRNTDEDPGVDLVMDCGGAFSHFAPRIGFVELTRSGIYKYEGHRAAVFMADSGRVKMIETLLGTGESYFRAMESLGYNHWQGKSLVVFGSGKVGCGIIAQAYANGASVVAVTELGSMPESFNCFCREIIDYKDSQSVIEAIDSAYAVVTATGHADAIKDENVVRALIRSSALLANMGVEDEYGANVPASEVLCQKRPLNFILNEPTQMQYIEATMALSNIGALYLYENKGLSGIVDPPSEIEASLLERTRSNGIIAHQMALLDLYGSM